MIECISDLFPQQEKLGSEIEQFLLRSLKQGSKKLNFELYNQGIDSISSIPYEHISIVTYSLLINLTTNNQEKSFNVGKIKDLRIYFAKIDDNIWRRSSSIREKTKQLRRLVLGNLNTKEELTETKIEDDSYQKLSYFGRQLALQTIDLGYSECVYRIMRKLNSPIFDVYEVKETDI